MLPRFVSPHSFWIGLLNPPPVPPHMEHPLFDTLYCQWVQLQLFIRPKSPSSTIDLDLWKKWSVFEIPFTFHITNNMAKICNIWYHSKILLQNRQLQRSTHIPNRIKSRLHRSSEKLHGKDEATATTRFLQNFHIAPNPIVPSNKFYPSKSSLIWICAQ